MKAALATLLLSTASAEIIKAQVNVLFQGQEFPMICTLGEPSYATLKFPTDKFPTGCPLLGTQQAVIDGVRESDGSITVNTIDKVRVIPHPTRT
jgi:hypothetical protein